MRRIVIDMQNVLFADAVAEALRNFDSNLEPVMSESPDKTLSLCDAVLANVLIMEVTVYTSWTLEERLKIRNALKRLSQIARSCWWWMKTQRKSWRTGCGRPRRTVW